MKLTKKAQAVSLGNAPQIVLLLALVVMIAGAAALALNAFSDSTTAGSYARNITTAGLTSLDNFSTQIPTVGTVVGVALIIVVVVGAFSFFGRRGGL